MFTVKVCEAGIATYFMTDAVTKEVTPENFERIQFAAQGEERQVIFRGAGDPCAPLPEGIPVADVAYLMNEQGKTIDIFR